MGELLKGIFDKLFSSNQKLSQEETKAISQEEVEALVDAKLKEHAATIEKSISEQASSEKGQSDQENYSLTPKQVEFALSLIEKVGNEYELGMATENLTIKDLNKLIAYNRYKNKGILVNLVKKGVLRRKNN